MAVPVLVLVATGLHDGTTLGSSYDWSLVLCTIIPGEGILPGKVTKTLDPHSQTLAGCCSVSLIKVTLLHQLELFI